MADDIELIGESAKKSAAELDKVRKRLKDMEDGLDATVKMLIKGADTDKKRIEITKLYNNQLKNDLELLKRSNQAEELEIKLLETKIDQNEKLIEQYNKSSSFLGSFGMMVKGSGKGLKGMTSQANLAKLAFQGIAGLGKGIVNLAGNFLDAEKKVEGIEDLTKHFKGIPFLGGAFNNLGKTLDFNISNFRTLAQLGADFNSSVLDMRYAAAAAGMPLLDFVDAVAKNSELFAQLFGTTQLGVKQFQGLAQRLRTLTMNEFSQFGLTLDETGEFLSSYLELERARGNIQRLTQADLIAGTAAYTKQLVLLSKLTGEDIKSIDARNRQQATNGKFQALLSGLSAEQADKMRLANSRLAQINPLFSQLFEETFAFGQAANTSTAQLNLFTGGALVPAFKAFKNGQIGFTELLNRVGEGNRYLIQNNSNLARATLVTGQFSDVLTAGAAGIRMAVNPEQIKKELEARDTATGELVKANDALKRFKAGVEKQTTDIIAPLFGDQAKGFYESAVRNLDKAGLSLAQFSIFNDVYDAGAKALRVVMSGSIVAGIGKAVRHLFKNKDRMAESLTNADTVFPDDMMNFPGYKTGSDGFRDFGKGTLVKLHDKETVIPLNSPMGKVVASLEGAKLDQNPQKVENINNAINNVTQGGDDFTQVATAITQGMNTLAGKMDESKRMLNTIAGASAQTAQNTGKANKLVARNPYSVV